MNRTQMCVDFPQSSLGDLPLVMEFGILASGNSVDPHGRAREFVGSDELLLLPLSSTPVAEFLSRPSSQKR